MDGYRTGLTISNGSTVNFQCESDYTKSTSQPIECILGQLFPTIPACNPISSPHYMGGSDIIRGGDITVLNYGNSGQSCGPPAK